MLNIRESRRFKAEDRYISRVDKALETIGYLNRDGKTICYIFPIGGKYHEEQQSDLVNFLIRNRYV